MKEMPPLMSIRIKKNSLPSDFLSRFKKKYKTILADPPWRFKGRQGKLSPEYKGCFRYPTLPLKDIIAMPVKQLAASNAHLYLWIPVSMIHDGLVVMSNWGFTYKTSITWEKIRKDGLPDGSGYGHYFRNSVEVILFGVKGSLPTTKASHCFPNIIRARKREHSRKPDEQYRLIESCSPGPYLELFARHSRKKWDTFGNQTKKFAVA